MTETAEPQQQENPLLEGLELRRTPDPCVLVIFGASGDLTRRKLFPALYSLALRRLLPEKFAVVGVARSEETDDEFRDRMKDAVQEFGRDEFKEDIWSWLADGMRYLATDFADEAGENHLAAVLNELDRERGTAGNRVYYLAVPPNAISTLLHEIGERRSTEGWTRVIIEKPFGRDLDSARELNEEIKRHFTEKEIFRIDHYLGKETVQNLMALRFANGIFEPIWNRQFVDHVQITVAESIGIEGRSAFYEQAGAIRDVFQNHLLQLVALTAMEPPIDFKADSVRNEKVKVLRALHTPGPKHVVRGQYGRGYVEGEEVPGYREEEGVAGDSLTETYVAAKLYVDNWRWADTPVLRAGGQAPRAARDDDRDRVQARAAPAVRDHRRRGPAPERARRPHPAGRRRLARVRGEDAGSGDDAARPSTWTSSTAAPSAPGSPRPTSGCCSTASSATRRSSRAPTRSRSSGRWWTRSSGSGSATNPRSRTTRPARGGPWPRTS